MNFLDICLEDFQALKLPPADFKMQMCPRCKNAKCEFSRWARDPMAERAATQMDRFFKSIQADPQSSRYEHLVDFRELGPDWTMDKLTTGPNPIIPNVATSMAGPPTKIILPLMRNTEVPPDGIFVGGPPPPKQDPWTAPKPVANKVEPGARIQMGSVTEKKNG